MASRNTMKLTLQLMRDKCDMASAMVSNVEKLALHPGTPPEVVAEQVETIRLTLSSPGACDKVFGQGTGYVYTLALEDECFYVGYTENLLHRIQSHFDGSGSSWTKTHRPTGVLEVVRGDKSVEKEKTLAVMKEHGWEKTRGYSWTQVNMLRPPRLLKFIQD